jgi:hypothetical protein
VAHTGSNIPFRFLFTTGKPTPYSVSSCLHPKILFAFSFEKKLAFPSNPLLNSASGTYFLAKSLLAVFCVVVFATILKT